MKIKTKFNFQSELRKELMNKFEKTYFGDFLQQSDWKISNPQRKIELLLLAPYLDLHQITNWISKGAKVPDSIDSLIENYIETGANNMLNPLITDFSDYYIEREVNSNMVKIYADEPFTIVIED